jgi:hypothetical protein
MNDLELEMLAAELARRGRDRDSIIFLICREYDLQWSQVEPLVDHVLSSLTPRIDFSFFGLRSLLLLAGLVIGGGLMITAGVEAIGLAEVAAPEADPWTLVKTAASLVFASVRLWSQLFLGGIAFALCLGRLLPYFAQVLDSTDQSS